MVTAPYRQHTSPDRVLSNVPPDGENSVPLASVLESLSADETSKSLATDASVMDRRREDGKQHDRQGGSDEEPDPVRPAICGVGDQTGDESTEPLDGGSSQGEEHQTTVEKDDRGGQHEREGEATCADVDTQRKHLPVLPVFVVEDTDEHLVTYIPEGAEMGFVEAGWPTPDGKHPWHHKTHWEARRIRDDVVEEHGPRWQVLADPEGNEVCIVATADG